MAPRVSSAHDPEDLEPVAIVGIGCRFPGGVNSPDDLWQLLVAGSDAVGKIPAERWESYAADPRVAGALRGTTDHGAFLADAAAFDAQFFGVTPREAELMDPQQRIVLETSWQALEDAGIPPDRLAGTSAGVFVGVGSDDYGRQMLEDLPSIEAWSGIGASMCGVPNRVSYVLDLRGPSLAVDTACSSSLVAIHLACQSLRSGESTLALAGGVNVIAGPGLTMVLDAAGATAPDGRSKCFDASADGYGRGEGAGILALKRLADARRDGDPIRAVIRGSAVNQDGRTNGIMAPSGDAQEHVVREALHHYGIDPGTVDFVEAHGTGTRMGDPIEVEALNRVYGHGRPAAAPCLIGSVKGNIGHLEAGAGVAGVVKAVLALEHALIPPTANVTELNPGIRWQESGLRVATEPTPWPQRHPVRRAGVSGFGYGGTVSHVLLEQAPETAAEPRLDVAGATPRLFALSSSTEAGVRGQAAALRAWLDDAGAGADASLEDVAHSLLTHRSHLAYRATVVADDRAALIATLDQLVAGEPNSALATARTLGDLGPGPVWVFSGHGSQWLGMGRELLAAEPVFRDVLATIDPIFQDEIGFSPTHVLTHGPLEDVVVIQPMIFAMQVGLSAVLRARGLEPGAVVGHSVGEIAAAVTAGIFDLADGARLICRRSALLRRVAGRGAMAMVSLPFAEVADRLNGSDDVVAAIAASPSSTVISGTPAGVAEMTARWRADNLMLRPVASDVAFHSPQMDPLLDDLVAALADLTPAAPEVTIYSTALADPRSDARRDGHYWAANLRNPVRLADAVTAASADGHRVFVELSAHPVVVHSISETLAESHLDNGLVTGTLRREQSEGATLLASLGALHCHGAIAEPERLQLAGRRTALPGRAWQHRPYWRTPSSRRRTSGGQHDVDSYSLLGAPSTVAGTSGLQIWHTYLDSSSRPYPGSHPIQGVEVVPAAVLLNTFLAAGRTQVLTDVQLKVPVAVTGDREIQVVRQDRTIRLASRLVDSDDVDTADLVDGGQSWSTHTVATVGPSDESAPILGVSTPSHPSLPALPTSAVVERLHAVGIADVGFPWQIDTLAGADGELVATVRHDPTGDHAGIGWPSLFDAVLSIAPLAFSGAETLRMPAMIERVTVGEPLPEQVVIHVQPSSTSPADTTDVVVTDSDAIVLGELTGVRFATLDDPGTSTSPRRLVHPVEWRPVQIAPTAESRLRTVALVGEGPSTDAVADALATLRLRCRRIADPEALAGRVDELGPDDAVLVMPVAPTTGESVSSAARGSAWRLASTAQLLARRCGMHAPALWAVTCGARESQRREDVAQGALWGLGRVIAGEHPELWGGLIDLDAAATVDAPTLANLLRARPGAESFALRDGAILAERLVPVSGEPSSDALQCHADGTYLITGGLGALGVDVGRWLASRGAQRLVLLGRTPLPPRAQWDAVTDPEVARRIAAVRSLEAIGVTVRVLAVDIADPAAAAAALTPDALGLPPIRGVVHAAGVLDNRMLDDLDEASLQTVMRPKVDGALVLHELFPPGSVDFFVLFSSVGLQLGLTGQASYASANACLDALARHRHASGHHDTTSFAWTSWRSMGMAANEFVDLELADRGVGHLSTTDAFGSWEFASRYDLAYAAVLPMVGLPPRATALPILGEIAAPAVTTEDGDEPLDFGDLSPDELRSLLVSEVSQQIGAELKISTDELDVRLPLVDMGLDSIMTVAIRRGLERRFGLSLPATLLWNHPTADAVAGHLAERLADRTTESTDSSDEPEPEAGLVGVTA